MDLACHVIISMDGHYFRNCMKLYVQPSGGVFMIVLFLVCGEFQCCFTVRNMHVCTVSLYIHALSDIHHIQSCYCYASELSNSCMVLTCYVLFLSGCCTFSKVFSIWAFDSFSVKRQDCQALGPECVSTGFCELLRELSAVYHMIISLLHSCYSYCVVSESIHPTPHGRSLEIPRGRGSYLKEPNFS